MSSKPLTAEEKERFLRAVETDREFRLALMGLLGMKEILERILGLEERLAKLEEKFAELKERQARLEEEMSEFRRLIFVIAHRFGAVSESAFREAMRYVVEDSLGAGDVERVVLEDREGIVYGHPSIVEVDVVVKDDKHVIVEIKSRVSRGNVGEVYSIGKLYEKVKGVRPDLVIVGGFIDRDAARLARKLGVRIVPAVEQVV